MTQYDLILNEDLKVTKQEVMDELQKHALPQEEIDYIFRRLGNHSEYSAKEVLEWLGC